MNGRAYKQAELLDSGKYPVLRVGNFNTMISGTALIWSCRQRIMQIREIFFTRGQQHLDRIFGRVQKLSILTFCSQKRTTS
ncbi:hypothetical protein ABMB44_13935 [Levilactobacillus brevis]